MNGAGTRGTAAAAVYTRPFARAFQQATRPQRWLRPARAPLSATVADARHVGTARREGSLRMQSPIPGPSLAHIPLFFTCLAVSLCFYLVSCHSILGFFAALTQARALPTPIRPVVAERS